MGSVLVQMPMQVRLQGLPGGAGGLQPRAQLHEEGAAQPHCSPLLWVGSVSPVLLSVQVFIYFIFIFIYFSSLLFFYNLV